MQLTGNFEGFIEEGTEAAGLLEKIEEEKLPRHVAVIMDGNGRWAKQRNKPRIEGHRAGIKAVRETVETSARLGVEALTLYAFSTENWARPKKEIKELMSLLNKYLKKEYEVLQENDIRFNPIGKLRDLNPVTRNRLNKVQKKTADNTRMVFNIALSYSGRTELTEAFGAILKDVKSGKLDISPEDVDEELIEDYLYTAGLPDPDLLIRTSGEYRISNFLLWQLAYCELHIIDTLWPDFRKQHLLEAIIEFQDRERRYGGID